MERLEMGAETLLGVQGFRAASLSSTQTETKQDCVKQSTVDLHDLAYMPDTVLP